MATRRQGSVNVLRSFLGKLPSRAGLALGPAQIPFPRAAVCWVHALVSAATVAIPLWNFVLCPVLADIYSRA